MQTKNLELTDETDKTVLAEFGVYACNQGWTDKSCADTLPACETDYLTGLDVPMMGFGIAIPHISPDRVTGQAVLLELLSMGESIASRSMGNPDGRVDTEIVVLLLITDTDGYSSLLSSLAKLFQTEELAELTKCRDVDGLLDLVVEHCVDLDG